jgi:Xaa-Pro aminopeptidase
MSLKNFSNRIQTVYQACSKPALVIENPIDLFYLTGLNLSLGTLIISSKGGHLFVDGRYIAFATKNSPCPCEKTTPQGLTKLLNSFAAIGFDTTFTSYERWQELKNLTQKELIPLKNPTSAARVIKSTEEIKALKKSAALLWKGFQYLKKKLKAGITEKAAASLFEVYCLENGAEKMAFEPIVSFGKNTAFPHYRPGVSRLKKGDCVLLDLGVVVNHYHSDMTRTFFFGKPHPKLLAFKAAVKEAHDAALLLCRPGVKVGDLDKAACQVIEQAGLKPYLAHSLGHGVGLEIHEFPRLKSQGEDSHVILKEGMVITIEPGLYAPGVGGYRYEDTIVITRKGYENWYPAR